MIRVRWEESQPRVHWAGLIFYFSGLLRPYMESRSWIKVKPKPDLSKMLFVVTETDLKKSSEQKL